MNTDLKVALRSFAADPGFSIVVVLTLALAIGVNSAIFSVLHGVLLRPLPYAEPDRLVMLWEANRQLGQLQANVSGATYLDWRARTRAFSAIGAFRHRGFTLTNAGDAQRLASVEVSPVLFRVLGVAARAGRTFTDDEERPGSGAVVVLSHGAWSRRFGRDDGAIGKTVWLDDKPHEIVGVMPPEFQFPADSPDVELWSPLTLDLTALQSRPHRSYQTIGRLAPGATMMQAQADLDAIARDIARDHPDSNAGWGVTLEPAQSHIVGDVGRTLWVLFAAVVLVLLIACANIANLLLARSAQTSRDFAVRAAFGAPRAALLRRSLADSAVLATAGGVAGLGLAYWGIAALRRLVPASVPRADGIGLDWPVVLFTVAIAAGSGVLFAMVPAWRAARPRLMDVLQEGGRSATSSRRVRRMSSAMVVAEVALALVLLVGAGLLIRSFAKLSAVDPGFRTAGVTALHIALPPARYQGTAPKRQFFVDLVERVRGLPGMTAVGAVSVLPMSPLGVQFTIPFTIDGLAVASPSERPTAGYRGVLAGYFEAMAIPIVKGRVFDAFDGREGGPRVAIINETAAARYFADVDPIGKLIKMPMAGDLQIVGVAGDVKQGGLQASAASEVFVPYYQLALSEMQIVVASDRTAEQVAAAVRPIVANLDPQLPIAKVSAIEDLVSASIAQPRFNMALLVGLSLSAALLAAVGVYGVVAYTVGSRRPEIGLRLALGAGAAGTFRLVVGGAVRLVLAGVALGLAAAALVGRSIEGLLFGVPAFDLATYVLAGLALVAVGLVAASLPAARAARIDPVGALRS